MPRKRIPSLQETRALGKCYHMLKWVPARWAAKTKKINGVGMGIWLDELERESVAKIEKRAALNRRALSWALEERHQAVHEGRSEDCVLLVLHLQDAAPPPALADLLCAELQRGANPVYALRDGQCAILLTGPFGHDPVRATVARVQRRLSLRSKQPVRLLFGAARALEARRQFSDWLALADVRLLARKERLGLRPVLAPDSTASTERRRTGLR
jgi:hypothetical protein